MLLLLACILLGAKDAFSDTKSGQKPEKFISGSNKNVQEALDFLRQNDIDSGSWENKAALAQWGYANDLTDANKKIMLDTQQEYSKYKKQAWKVATSFAWKDLKSSDALSYRWFKALSILGSSALPENEYKELHELMADMENTYSKAKVCERNVTTKSVCGLSLEPDLSKIMEGSRDYDELTYAWKSWRDVSGKKIRERYLKYVSLVNKAAHLNGFSDGGELWRESYESEEFVGDLEDLWNQLKPFYMQLHAYVRRTLMKQYPGKIKPDGPIPAHLLGNMWAQTWGNIAKLTEPYPDKPEIDITDAMKAKNMTALDMFKLSEEFFTSLGLKAMTPTFWKKSVIEKPTDREITCHASAWDFYDREDFRIKMCTRINMEDLITVHHEMGHIQYYQQYAHQPVIFREGANPGFHEAVGDVLALSVATPHHLKEINLLKEVSEDDEADINYLLKMALDKVAFLPFGYLIDLWRWDVFSGSISAEEMNTRWWDMRLKYQGICPPVERTEDDFDPGSKYHIPASVPYIRYFVSFVIQFQFHKALCEEAGHQGPLYKCDIYRSKEAGKLLSDMLEKGGSLPWGEAMSIITRGETSKMDATGLLEYFDPLIKWLQIENADEFVGWNSESSTICPQL